MKRLAKAFFWMFGVILCLPIALIGSYWIYETAITSDDPSDFKYPVWDLRYDKYVDASPLIKSGKFKPKYCKGSIDKLTRVTPKVVKAGLEADLKASLKAWQTSHATNSEDQFYGRISSSLKYEYSQLLDRDPIDCYSLKVSSGKKLYIRTDDNDHLFGGFNDWSWVTNSCE